MFGKDLYTQRFLLYRDENMKNETMYDKGPQKYSAKIPSWINGVFCQEVTVTQLFYFLNSEKMHILYVILRFLQYLITKINK